ncbi:MAG: hypothetical protein DRN78_06335 [Thermoproteota archaeon]|nr:hypothetical protein [Candidatus Korarchaeota archaeon]RLG39724.1 MAG: hypothetical protein DRN78_06335 [Candidatus Korarchaeota archaeon]
MKEYSSVEEIVRLVADSIIQVREKGSLAEETRDQLETLLGKLEGTPLQEMISAIFKGLKEGQIDDRSLLGKSLKLGPNELKLVVRSLDEFISTEPFKDMETLDLMKLWKDILKELLKHIEEGEEAVTP